MRLRNPSDLVRPPPPQVPFTQNVSAEEFQKECNENGSV
jgi:hypothetical protein